MSPEHFYIVVSFRCGKKFSVRTYGTFSAFHILGGNTIFQRSFPITPKDVELIAGKCTIQFEVDETTSAKAIQFSEAARFLLDLPGLAVRDGKGMFSLSSGDRKYPVIVNPIVRPQRTAASQENTARPRPAAGRSFSVARRIAEAIQIILGKPHTSEQQTHTAIQEAFRFRTEGERLAGSIY